MTRKLLRNISKIKRYLRKDELHKLVHAIISSKIDYCNGILFGVKLSTIAKLQAVQTEAARIMSCLPSGASVPDSVFVDLHWLRIRERIVFKLLLLVHKFFLGKSASYFSDLLLVKDMSKRLLYEIFVDSPCGRRAFSYASPRLWNNLPEAVRLEDNSEKFKKLLKTVLFRNTNNIMQTLHMYRT